MAARHRKPRLRSDGRRAARLVAPPHERSLRDAGLPKARFQRVDEDGLRLSLREDLLALVYRARESDVVDEPLRLASEAPHEQLRLRRGDLQAQPGEAKPGPSRHRSTSDLCPIHQHESFELANARLRLHYLRR